MRINELPKTTILRWALCWAAVLMCAPSALYAQEPEEQEDEIEQIIVTGSRIRSGISHMDPVLILDRDAIERSGVLTVAEALQQLPLDNAGSVNDRNPGSAFGASAVSFRGLGPGTVLVLVNGRRISQYGFSVSSYPTFISFVDLNGIPLSAVDRIDVLKDGASAIYGSDAIAGVINIVLRRDFSGAEMTARLGAAQEDGAEEKAFNALWGRVGSKTSVQLMASYTKRDELYWRDRAISRSANHSARGGFDQRSIAAANFRLGFPPEANGAECEERGTIAGIQEFETVEVPTFSGDVAVQCLYDFNSQMTEPSTERLGITAVLYHEMKPDLGLNIEASYVDSKLETRYVANPVARIYPQSNPWNPFGQDVFAYYRLLEAGPRIDQIKNDNIRMLVELEGVLRQWDWNLGALYNRTETRDQGTGYINLDSLDAALNGVDLNGDSVLQRNEYLNLYTPASNPNSDQLIDTLRSSLFFGAETELYSLDGTISGPLVALPAGDLNFALGFEQRHESMRDRSDPQSRSGDVYRIVLGTPAEASGSRDVSAVFIELRIPVLAGLDLQAAIRYDDYSNFGTQSSPKLALQWRPFKRLMLRGSWSKGFRAPSLVELHYPRSELSFISAFDPRRCPVLDYSDECLLNGNGAATGGSLELQPETSESFVLGLSAELIHGLTVKVDYWNIKHDNRIAFPGFDYILYSEDLLGPSYILREPPTEADIALGIPGRLTQVNELPVNLSRQHVDGYDINVNYTRDASRFGKFSASLFWTHMLSNQFAIFPPGSSERFPENTGYDEFFFELQENAGTYGYPENRVNLNLFWQRDSWGVSLHGRWIDSFDAPLDWGVATGQVVASQIEWDTSITYAARPGLRFSLGIKNLFNEDPPFAPGRFHRGDDDIKGFPTQYYAMRGRFAYLTATFSTQ